MSRDLRNYVEENFDRAIDYHYIQPYYQPVIRTASRKLCSFEVLARWMDPEKGMIFPDEFIPVLEDVGKIHLLDEHIIRQACFRFRLRMSAGDTPIPISVNLSRRDFELCDIFSVVDGIVSEYRLPHDFIYIEITESVIAEQKELMMEEVNKFRANGYQVWMDDFGSAYSSLNILKEFDFDELKLDMGFLRPFNVRSKRIATSIIDMAKGINTHTLVEGVETEEQFSYLRNIGCEKVQGYYFGKPMPYKEAIENMESQGIKIEKPQDRVYYDDIGKINYLSAVPFMTKEDRDSIDTARQLNSIPLAIVEMHEHSFSILFYNSAFEETAKDTGMFANIFKQELLRVHQPFDLLSEKVLSLLDSTLSEEGHMRFISNDQYYEIQAKCIARSTGKYSVLMRLSNLSETSKSESTQKLDEFLRRVYAVYERVTLIDLNEDRIYPLFMTTREELVSQRTGSKKMAREYAEQYLYPEDREKYLKMVDPDTIEERIAKHGKPFITSILRTLSGHGEYVWKEYTDLRLEHNKYMILIRNVHDSVKELERNIYRSVEEEGSDLSSQLWNNLINSDLLSIFWKDKDRRFLGASNSFLKYYGFESLDDIVGKNDEEMGWHLHPDRYRDDEYRVLHEGSTTHNIPGRCLVQGENREILASKTPLYNENGEIRGLMGYFIDRDLLSINDSRGTDIRKRDIHTGLMNTRGLSEESNRFRDEYYLRKTDFVRMHISIDNFQSFNDRYGYDFGDRVLNDFGNALKKGFGRSCVVGRQAGSKFAILKQINDLEDARLLCEQLRHVAASVSEVGGRPMTLYTSIGYALFSENENLEEQETLADRRILADHSKNVSSEVMISRAAELFSFFDDLPVVYAVYHVTRNAKTGTTDAILFYVNHEYEKAVDQKAGDILGRGVRELYAFIDENWHSKMVQAALEGEDTTDLFVFEPTGTVYRFYAKPIIYAGYCAVTYLETAERKDTV